MVIYRHMARLALIVCAFAGLNAVCAQETAPVVKPPVVTTPVATPVVTPPVVIPAVDDLDNTLYLDLSTGGRVTIKLFPLVAPNHVERIKTLARKGFYNGVVFHRVIDGFMAQSGDPTGTGQGGSDLPDLKAEFNAVPHLRGTLSMAHAASPDSGNSQFFICFQPRFSLDKKYTVFGRVTSGMEYVDAIARGEPPATPDRIVKATIAADVK
jgi:cyclophilin family peptidyl-prolyl cis-trans isomerase